MPRPEYSKSQYERDLADKIVSFDEQALKEIDEQIPKTNRRGWKVKINPQYVRQHARHIFNAAYERHIAK